MRRHVLVQRTALAQPITADKENRNPVMRIGAFTEGRAEKAASELRRAPTFAAKSRSTKSLTLSQGVDIVGVFSLSRAFRTPRSLSGWQGDIRSNAMCCDADKRATVNGRRVSDWFTRCFGRPKPILRVNTVESARWEAAYHALVAWPIAESGTMPERRMK